MSHEVESILLAILERRGIFFSRLKEYGTTRCQACRRKEVEYGRKLEPEKKFCSPLCNKAEYILSKMFPLGMKRVREEIIVEESDVFRWLDLPSELQAHVILLIFDYRIENVYEWDELMKLKELISKSNQSLIDTQVIPVIQYIDDSVHRRFSQEQLMRFVGLQKFSTWQKHFHIDWSLLLGNMKQLVDFDFHKLMLLSGVKNFVIDNLTHLTRLVCRGCVVRDENLRGLTNLRTLTFHFECAISDETLLRMPYLRRFELVKMKNTTITPSGLQSLPSLRKLVLYGIPEIENDFVSGLTQLESLTLIETWINNLETLVNLKSLHLEGNGNGDGFTPETFVQLTNLTKLSTQTLERGMMGMTKLKELNLGPAGGGWSDEARKLFLVLAPNLKKLTLEDSEEVPDEALVVLTNLTSLALPSNSLITNRGLYTLTNLTFLDLRGNSQITSAVLPRLKSLRRLQESKNRIYRIENGAITGTH